MAPNFELTYSLDDLKPEKLVQNCRLRVTVSWRDIVMMEKDFFYCLHCQKVFSRTGFYYHKFRFSYTLREVEVIAADFISNQSRHDLLLKNEFERRFEKGKMRRVTYVQPTQQQTIAFTPYLSRLNGILQQESQDPLCVEQESLSLCQKKNNLNVMLNQLMFLTRFKMISQICSTVFRTRDSIPVVSRTISKISLVNFRNESRKKTEKIQNEKAKIVSVLAQHLYIMCTLSKDQIKTSLHSGRR